MKQKLKSLQKSIKDTKEQIESDLGADTSENKNKLNEAKRVLSSLYMFPKMGDIISPHVNKEEFVKMKIGGEYMYIVFAVIIYRASVIIYKCIQYIYIYIYI